MGEVGRSGRMITERRRGEVGSGSVCVCVFCGFGGTKWRCGKFPRESDGSQGGQHPLRRRIFFLGLFLDLFWVLDKGFGTFGCLFGWIGVPIREARPAGAVQFGVMGSGNNKDYLQVFGFPGKKSTQYVKQIMR